MMHYNGLALLVTFVATGVACTLSFMAGRHSRQ